MHPIYFHNTLGKQKQAFAPLKDGEVSMYSCGPTVYNDAHIGNLRAYVFADVLKRTLIYNGYKVRHIINVTDIGHITSDADSGDDKMVNAIKREGLSMSLKSLETVAHKYFDKFIRDTTKLNILKADQYPFASEHIKEDIEMIETLLDKGFAYETSTAIYFDTSKQSDYGAFGTISDNTESRIQEDSEKRNQRDFALWKFADEGSTVGFSYGDRIKLGFPGWHIECSAMSERYLGVPFDIHTGGIDHIPVHHTNEIAQTKASRGVMLANYWLHSEHLTIGQDKMAKSGENFLTLSYLESEGVTPLSYRYWLLTSRYSTRVDYSLEAIKASGNALQRLKQNLASTKDIGEISEGYKTKFLNFINDDLDTPKALALVWELLKDSSVKDADKKATIIDFDKVLGLGLDSDEELVIPKEVAELLEMRSEARRNKNWQESDNLRDKIKSLGFELKDTDSGQQVTKI